MELVVNSTTIPETLVETIWVVVVVAMPMTLVQVDKAVTVQIGEDRQTPIASVNEWEGKVATPRRIRQ